MLVLMKEADEFVLEHSSEKNPLLRYRFNKEQLTENAFAHLEELNVFSSAQEISLLLTEKQDHAFHEVLTKILSEKDDAYRFSRQLQHTYLIELIHLITKVYHEHLSVVK